MAAVLALVVVLVVLGVSFAPLLGEETAGAAPARDGQADLQIQRDRLVAALKDIDLDLAMGKVDEIDHAELKKGLESELVALLVRIDKRQEGAEETPEPGAEA